MKNILHSTITALAVVVLFFSCGKNREPVMPKECDGKFPDESATDIHIVFSDAGVTSFELFAPVLNKYIGDTVYMDCPQGITIYAYDEWGEKQSMLTADYAISSEVPPRMEASKNVVIKDLKKNETIETEQIIWDKNKQMIYSVVPVKQTKADGTVNYGDGFEADEHFSKYRVFNPRGEMIMEEL
ncbi:MAG: LPS export ABC transporter periplasmic protein LptC [Bacteroidales bacterium]|nr:LPS export ABC transporter periplasmic protein LptC [Bacteroidales bacterium]